MTIQNQKAGESLLRERSVLAKVGLSRAYWWKLVAAGTAPRPIKIGRASLWIASEIDAFIQTRIAESRAPNAA
jgi:predicted DNA-binding transcriptional regulator AlpA